MSVNHDIGKATLQNQNNEDEFKTQTVLNPLRDILREKLTAWHVSLMIGKRFRIIYQDDTNIPDTQTPDDRQCRCRLTESTPLSLEHNPGVNNEAENHGISPEKKRNLSCGPIVECSLGDLHNFYSLFSSTLQKRMINEISNPKISEVHGGS